MASARTKAFLLALFGLLLAAAVSPVWALDLVRLGAPTTLVQPAQAAVEPSQRHCQTILACNLRRGGSYRGCISAYSCRACRFVKANCRVVEGRRVCEHRSRCDWGL